MISGLCCYFQSSCVASQQRWFQAPLFLFQKFCITRSPSNHDFTHAGVMRCGSAEATGLDFVCFVVSTLVCCQPTELIWAFLFHKFSILLPLQPELAAGSSAISVMLSGDEAVFKLKVGWHQLALSSILFLNNLYAPWISFELNPLIILFDFVLCFLSLYSFI